MKEQEPFGTVVIQVHAEDRDPPEEGGTITYRFVTYPEENLKFEINNKTGLIRTTQIFDRDEPFKEKETYLTVLATDNGKPQLNDVCTFKVTIEDVNDNGPVFDKVAYTESVPQDLPVGREVMRVSATDIDDGNNSVVRYSLSPKRPDDAAYFRIDRESGIIFLNKAIDRTPGYKFSMTATAEDLGEIPQSNAIHLDIRVVESHKKAPAFLPRSSEPIRLKENFNDFDSSIVRLKAVSNIENSSNSDNSYLVFELVTGRNTFKLEPNKDVADIKLSQHLDYENNTQYSLIVRVLNKYGLAAETVVDIEVLDVNDNIPVFLDIKGGSVLENEPRGVPVMQVRAIDLDGTSANNQVSYELENFKDLFAIDPQTGNIITLVTFDREVEDSYSVKIIATDNAPSALLRTGEHNKAEQVFQIKIADKNDNPPRFTRKVYTHNSIYENANINALVTEVKAIDSDTASSVMYSIISGNTDDSFYIEATTGKIRANKPLDYEKITKYNLTVKAFDGVFNDTAQVEIFIEKVSFGIDTNFIVAILVCILIFLVMAVVHRRTHVLYNDINDIRENIINYEDEGGGETDAGYDLNVLRAIYDAPPIDSEIAPIGLQGRETDEVPDICGFLDGEESCDPDTNLFDDLRHYAYEGEGNSEADLSSLACTDDEDLNFDYLYNFGPKSKKLADLYRENSNDEESERES